jgi:putative Holliday junction resolvase
MGRILAIDYGSVRIGIAISDESNTIAFGKEVIPNDNKTLAKLKNLIVTNNVSEIILGYPLSLRNEKTQQTLQVESFEEKLKSLFPDKSIVIKRLDERFTSKMAADSMIESGMSRKNRQNKSNLDIISAALLLQGYLDSVKK